MLARPGGHEAIHPVNGAPIAFVASQGFWASELKPRLIWRSVARAKAREIPIISTFTSAQEREALRRALRKGRAIIQAIPQGIPRESDLPPELLAACREGRALLISPQPPESRLNKKVAAWCNEYVLRHADEIWAGDLSPNGMLSAMLKSLRRI